MLHYLVGLLFLGGLGWAQAPFRLGISDSKRNYNPHQMRTSAGQYINHQLFRNFYRFNENNDYVTELGDKCKKQKSRWVCSLKKDLKWSNGSPLTTEDFILSYQRILTTPSPRADLLFGIKNARAIHDKAKPLSELGIKALNSTDLEIEWESPEFASEAFLMSPLMVPLPKGQLNIEAVSGPYKIASQSPTKIAMDPNPHYFRKNDRPHLEWVLFEENLALEAYRRGELDFIRRVPTSLIPQYEKQDGYKMTYVFRLDALIFSTSLEKRPELRQALTTTLKYNELQKLFNSANSPGCVGLPLDFYSGDEICYKYKKSEAIKKFSGTKLSFAYSNLGGEDHRRLSEWLQSQWKMELDVDLSVQGLENKMFLQRLQSNPPDIFRKGLSPEDPSCYGALVTFTSNHPDNSSKWSNPKFDSLVKQLPTLSKAQARKTCRQALELLMDSSIMIPTGRFGISHMIRPTWTQVKINALNHLDLSELSKAKTK